MIHTFRKIQEVYAQFNSINEWHITFAIKDFPNFLERNCAHPPPKKNFQNTTRNGYNNG